MPFFGGGGASAGIGGSTGATDNAILRADGTGAATLQNSALVVDDAVITYPVTGDAATDVITAVGHNFVNGQRVFFSGLVGGTNFPFPTNVFVRNVSGDTFQVSTTSGGAIANFTTDITAGFVVATQDNVSIRNNTSDTNSAIVLTPKGTGGLILGPPPDSTSVGGNRRGANSICLVGTRTAATQVASGGDSFAAIRSATASGAAAIAIGAGAEASQNFSIALSDQSRATAFKAICIGNSLNSSLRAQFITHSFSTIYWGGETTNATPLILDLDATATNRFTIAANTAIMADLFIIARRTDTVDKWFSSRQMVAIRRNNANGTAIIGSVQTIGADQTEGSPSWTVAVTADDTNEALQVEVTGAASETVQWRVLALYRVV